MVIDPDRLQAIMWFVAGAMLIHANNTDQKAQDPNFLLYIYETTEVVLGYVKGTRRLDGSCSDIQCHIALEAKKAFP